MFASAMNVQYFVVILSSFLRKNECRTGKRQRETAVLWLSCLCVRHIGKLCILQFNFLFVYLAALNPHADDLSRALLHHLTHPRLAEIVPLFYFYSCISLLLRAIKNAYFKKKSNVLT